MAIPKNWEHALDMLPHLARCANERKTISYWELGELIGHPHFYLGQVLEVLRDDILAKHGLPRLDALVVGKESGEAGESFYAEGKGNLSAEDYHNLLNYERQKVFDYPRWDEMVKRLQLHYGGEQYVKERGGAVQS